MEASTAFGLGPIAQIALTVRDVDAAVRFYRDRLRLPFLFQVPGMAFFDCGGVRLLVGTAEEGAAVSPAGTVVYFRVPDIHAAHQALAGQGVRFDAEPHFVARLARADLWLSFFRDEDGNTLALLAEVPRG